MERMLAWIFMTDSPRSDAHVANMQIAIQSTSTPTYRLAAISLRRLDDDDTVSSPAGLGEMAQLWWENPVCTLRPLAKTMRVR
jgi:hypothetical protein